MKRAKKHTIKKWPFRRDLCSVLCEKSSTDSASLFGDSSVIPLCGGFVRAVVAAVAAAFLFVSCADSSYTPAPPSIPPEAALLAGKNGLDVNLLTAAAHPAAASYMVYWAAVSSWNAADIMDAPPSNIPGHEARSVEVEVPLNAPPALLYTIPGLTPGTAYSVVVAALNKNKKVTSFSEVAAIIPPVISLKIGDAALTVSSVVAAVPAPESYTLYWKAGGGLSATEVINTGKSAPWDTRTAFVISPLANDVAYSVVAVAEKADFGIFSSAVLTDTPRDGKAEPLAPDIALSGGDGSIYVALRVQPYPVPESYTVYWKAGSAWSAAEVINAPFDNTPGNEADKADIPDGAQPPFPLYRISGLANDSAGTAYTVVVAAKTADAEDNLSPAVTVTIRNTIDAAPPVIQTEPKSAVYEKGASPVALTVSANAADHGSGGVLSYQWYRNTLNNANVADDSLRLPNFTSAAGPIPSTAALGTSYYYVKVTNTNSGVNGAKTAVTVSTIAMVTVTDAAFSASPGISLASGNHTLAVALDRPASPVPDSYTLYWKEGAFLNAADVIADPDGSSAPIPAASFPYTISGLVNGVVYTAAVRAQKALYVDALANAPAAAPSVDFEDFGDGHVAGTIKNAAAGFDLQTYLTGIAPGYCVVNLTGDPAPFTGFVTIPSGVRLSLRGSGTISAGTANTLFVVNSGAELIIRGPVLRGQAGASAALIVVQGTLKLRSGEITGHTNSTNGGGVALFGGTFEMFGGSIHGNKTGGGGHGAGVYNTGGTFIMHAGEIYDNISSLRGGGVYQEGGSFTMEDGAVIRGNKAGNGGGVGCDGGVFTMSGGEIHQNEAVDDGGGVGLYGGTASLSGAAKITGNKAALGGGVGVTGGTFTMSGGDIRSNNATDGGGGASVGKDGAAFGRFLMNGGSISENTAKDTTGQYGAGGGVHVGAGGGGEFTLNGGQISGNKAFGVSDEGGGGVFIFAGTFTYSSGTIENNVTTAGFHPTSYNLRKIGAFVNNSGLPNIDEAHGFK